MPILKNSKPKHCAECKKELVVTIPIGRIGNAYGEEWHPCQNRECNLHNQKVEKAIINP